MALLNQAQFAKQLGVARSYITQLKQDGRLVIVNGKVDSEASEQRINETKDMSKRGVEERHQQERNDKINTALGSIGPDGISGSLYQNARAQKEQFNALMAKLEYEKQIGELRPVAEIRNVVGRCHTIIRNRLELLPDTLTPQLAAMHDEHAVRAFLMNEIEALLAELSRGLQAMNKG